MSAALTSPSLLVSPGKTPTPVVNDHETSSAKGFPIKSGIPDLITTETFSTSLKTSSTTKVTRLASMRISPQIPSTASLDTIRCCSLILTSSLNSIDIIVSTWTKSSVPSGSKETTSGTKSSNSTESDATSETLPAPSRNSANTIRIPSPEGTSHLIWSRNGFQSLSLKSSSPFLSLTSPISFIFESLSEATRLIMIPACLVRSPTIDIDPIGAVWSKMIWSESEDVVMLPAKS